MAQWLGRQSLDGRLSDLPGIPDIWLTGDHSGKLYTMGKPTRPTQPSIPPELMSSDPCITGRGEWTPSNGRPGLCMAA